MSGLHRPVVVDPRLPNFPDTRMDVHCVPGDFLSNEETGALCQKVGALFEMQGALVTTHLSAGRSEDDVVDEAPTEAADGEEGPPVDDAAPRTELTLELRSRRLHVSRHPLSWALCVASFTLLSGVTEYTFAQSVVIRDGSGFLLLSDSLEGRIVRRFGFGSWAGNAVFDLWREDADKLTGDVADRNLSADLYQQLSQLVFNAKMHAEVLQQASPAARAD
jgi:hypothetical protein